MSINDIRDKVTATQDTVRQQSKKHADTAEHLTEKVDNAASTLRQVSRTTDSINTTVMSFRNLGIQLLQV